MNNFKKYNYYLIAISDKQEYSMRTYFVVSLLLFCMISCSNTNIKTLEINNNNKDEVIEKVKKSKDLTGEEVGLFFGSLARTSVSGKQLSQGKTVGNLIDDQRKVVEEEKAKEAEAKRLAEEAKQKEDKIAKELSEYITVVPLKKVFKKANIYNGEFQDKIVVYMVFENKGDKDIRAFKGKTIFNNLFGEPIYETTLYYDEGLKSKEKKRWIGVIKYNQFNEHHNKFNSTELDNMKYEWKPIGIMFKDGSKLGID
jgi:hypothetical protein